MTNTEKKEWLDRYGMIVYHYFTGSGDLNSGSWLPFNKDMARRVQGKTEYGIINGLYDLIRNEMFNRCNDDSRR